MRDTDLYLISVAARMLDMHPQTLRKYERLGLVRPLRTLGSMRVYTRDGRLVAEYGEQRRVPLAVDQIPDDLEHAILAAEEEAQVQRFSGSGW